ncbi:ribonuclease P protein component [Aestuariispira insulae]|nr:ribonuclease P protein component [Aestuariispira insulae]
MLPAVERLTRRSEYLRVAGARRSAAMPGLVLQARESNMQEATIRVGFTASRKVGKAVVRNRARRRLKAVAREILPLFALPGHDYVLIARAGTVDRPYPALIRDLKKALKRLKLRRDKEEEVGAEAS